MVLGGLKRQMETQGGRASRRPLVGNAEHPPQSYLGILSVCPILMRFGSLRMSLFASKIFM
jgi:hypothetical protein